MVKKSFYLWLVVLVFMGGCSTTNYSQRKLQAPLDGEWKSTLSRAILNFKDEKISGNDGCNHFSGGYESNADELRIDKNLVYTMMNCEENIMEKANIFRRNLAEVKRYTNDGKILRFLKNDGTLIDEFKTVSTSFDNGKYIVQSLNNGKKTAVALKHGISIFLELKGNSKMSGFTGCNRFSCDYLLNENDIVIFNLATTRKMCPVDNMRAEKSFIEVMKNGTKISHKNERWELRNASDVLLMEMIKE